VPASSANSFHTRRHVKRRRQSAEYREAYDLAAIEIGQIDQLIRELDDARERLGLSKADLAREIGKNPQVVRRLFSASTKNPELKTVAAIAAALGGRVTVDFSAATTR
jgi:ribosome-binding protein aMBF1 (putative translation factor)